MDGVYRPVTIVHTDETHHWGHSEVLNLDICWEDEQLRFWDPVAKRYLRTSDEMYEDRIAAEARADTAEARAGTERQARLEAEARTQELEEELRRQRDQ